jgi:hypothetical protein
MDKTLIRYVGLLPIAEMSKVNLFNAKKIVKRDQMLWSLALIEGCLEICKKNL